MKKPKLENYSDEMLIALTYNQDERLNERIGLILEERSKAMKYRDVYIKYKKSHGIEKLSLAKALSFHLSRDLYFCESSVIDDLFDHIDIEEFWELARDCPNDEIRNRARIEVDKALDEYDRTFKDEEVHDESNIKTKEKCKIIKFEKRGKL